MVVINYKCKTHMDKSTVLSLETVFCDIIKNIWLNFADIINYWNHKKYICLRFIKHSLNLNNIEINARSNIMLQYNNNITPRGGDYPSLIKIIS